MIYTIECDKCKSQREIVCHLEEYDTKIAPGMDCSCGGIYRSVVVSGGISFSKEGFPKGDPRWEHASDNPTFIRDKSHLKDVCEQNGNVSRYIEDDC